jgi:hypothetical protein
MQYRARLHKVTPYVEETLAHVVRRIEFTLTREYDEFVASGIGVAAKQALRAIENDAMTSCKLPITAFAMDAVLTGKNTGGTVKIENARGVSATCKKGKEGKNGEDDEPPIVELVFDAPFTEDVWLFLGREFGAWADVELTKRPDKQAKLFADEEGEDKPPTKPSGVPARRAS